MLMQESTADTNALLAQYEGLVVSTARRYESLLAKLGYDVEDIAQILRVKVWQAIAAFDEQRVTTTVTRCNHVPDCKCSRCRYVFMCIRNRAKDLVKTTNRHRATEEFSFIDDVAPAINGNGEVRDAFELRYLSVEEERAFASSLEPPPLIPSTLTAFQRNVLVLRFHDYKPREIAALLDVRRSRVDDATKAIKAKMADWRPTQEPTAVAA